MKKILSFLLIFVFFVCNLCFADENAGLRDYDGIELRQGSFIPVISVQEISTLYCDVGSQVKFISTSDMYIYDTIVIPNQTEFFGYVEKINEPVVGTNASMVIKITKLRLSDGVEIAMRGYIYSPNGNIIGGELTQPVRYYQKPSFRQGYPGMVGYVPGPERKMGEHKVIASGADLMIILASPLYITHTVTN